NSESRYISPSALRTHWKTTNCRPRHALTPSPDNATVTSTTMLGRGSGASSGDHHFMMLQSSSASSTAANWMDIKL
ncbi:unnamed protein product, partial [Sphagnum balticum]